MEEVEKTRNCCQNDNESQSDASHFQQLIWIGFWLELKKTNYFEFIRWNMLVFAVVNVAVAAVQMVSHCNAVFRSHPQQRRIITFLLLLFVGI